MHYYSIIDALDVMLPVLKIYNNTTTNNYKYVQTLGHMKENRKQNRHVSMEEYRISFLTKYIYF